MVDGELDYQCPRRPWLDDLYGMHTLYDAMTHYRNGFLMEPGGVLDQPVKMMSALVVMSNQVEKCKTDKDDSEREKERMRAAVRARAEAQFKPGEG